MKFLNLLLLLSLLIAFKSKTPKAEKKDLQKPLSKCGSLMIEVTGMPDGEKETRHINISADYFNTAELKNAPVQVISKEFF